MENGRMRFLQGLIFAVFSRFSGDLPAVTARKRRIVRIGWCAGIFCFCACTMMRNVLY